MGAIVVAADVCVVAQDVGEVVVPCIAAALLSSLADELPPGFATGFYSPSPVDAQLDCMLQAVCS